MMVPIVLLAEPFNPRAKMHANRKAENPTSLQIMQPRGFEDGDVHLFPVIVKLISQGINELDVKILKEASIHNCDDLMIHTKKRLIGYSSLPETKLDIICKAAETILRKPVIHVATADQGLDELLRGHLQSDSPLLYICHMSCKTQLTCTSGVSPKGILGPPLRSLLSHSPRIGDGDDPKGSVDQQDMDSTDSSSGNDRDDNNVDNAPLLPVVPGVPLPIPVVNLGHNGYEDQVVPNLNGDGRDPDYIFVYMDGRQAGLLPPQATETLDSLWEGLAICMEGQPNGTRIRAIGFRLTYWSLGSRLLIPINFDSLSPQWQDFRLALRKINVDTNVDNIPLLPVAPDVPSPIPVVNVGHNGNEDQVVPNLNNSGGGPNCILICIDGQEAGFLSPQITETLDSLWEGLAVCMEGQPNGTRIRAIGFRLTYWSLGSRLLIPINVDSISPQWQDFRLALRQINVDTNVEP